MRCGRYAATASAASSSVANPSTLLNMKSRMRALPSFSYRGTTSTSTSFDTFDGPARNAARMPVSPPMLAPISATGRPIASTTRSTSAQRASTEYSASGARSLSPCPRASIATTWKPSSAST